MTVKDLKELLKGVDDDMDVLIPLSAIFDGRFVSPCIAESGKSDLDLGEDDEPEQETECFILVPCGFFEVHEGVQAELN